MESLQGLSQLNPEVSLSVGLLAGLSPTHMCFLVPVLEQSFTLASMEKRALIH